MRAPSYINMGKPTEAPVDSWMGWSNGHWEGDTLVIDVTGMNDQTWFDRAGDYHSDSLHVIERYTPVNHDILTTKPRSKTPKSFRGRGKSVCLCTGMWKKTRS